MYRCVGVIDRGVQTKVPDVILMDEDKLTFMPLSGQSLHGFIKSGRVRNLSIDGSGNIKCSDVAFSKFPKYAVNGAYLGNANRLIVLCSLPPIKSFLVLDNNMRIRCVSEQSLISMLIRDKECCCNVKIGSDAVGDDKIIPLGGLSIPSVSKQSGPEKVGMGLRMMARQFNI